MSTLVVRGPGSIAGNAVVPGDKSISHRALMIGAVAEGETTVRNLGSGEDIASTISCLETYRVGIARVGNVAAVRGKGLRSWTQPDAAMDCGNSGTTLRTLAGLATHCAFPSVLNGDASLRKRPMDRLVKPLAAFGARVETSGGFPPITIEGGRLSGAHVHTGVASAQVKTAAIFAGLGAEGQTIITEPALSRDHTERLLTALGAPIGQHRGGDGSHRVELSGFAPPRFEMDVPGDVSSAAFLVAAAVLTGRVRVDGVGLNPTRIGFVELLARMGGTVRWRTAEFRMGEPVGWIEAERSELGPVGVEGPVVPVVLDELPLVAVMATQAHGTTTVTGAGELRAKESDRIATTIAALRLLGAEAEELPDGFSIHGPTPLIGTKVDGAGDHRVAMALAVAGLVAGGETLVDGFEAAAVSWPGFDRALAMVGADVELR